MHANNLNDVFTAMAGAAAALIGLLFVAVSVSPSRITGPQAPKRQQIRSSMALTSLVSPLLLSLIALLPDTGLGWPATIIGASGIFFVATTIRRIVLEERGGPSRRRFLMSLLGFLIATTVEAVTGIHLLVDPHISGMTDGTAAAAIGLLAVGIERSWELVGGHSVGIADALVDITIGRAEIEPGIAENSPPTNLPSASNPLQGGSAN